MSLRVCEIFNSLQGESSFVGLPCTFVRLSGCNLNCTWCDTCYAESESVEMTIEEIIKKVDRFDCPLVEVTGGEPLLQSQTPKLIHELLNRCHKVLLETNGSLPIQDLNPQCIRIIDIKCPSSGEESSFLWKNLEHLTVRDEIKFVVESFEDYQFAKQIIKTNLSHIENIKIHISPVFGNIEPQKLAKWMIEDKINARLSLQQHKIIWDPNKRGV